MLETGELEEVLEHRPLDLLLLDPALFQVRLEFWQRHAPLRRRSQRATQGGEEGALEGALIGKGCLLEDGQSVATCFIVCNNAFLFFEVNAPAYRRYE